MAGSEGREHQIRPRDALGRPLPYGAVGVEPVSDEALPPQETLSKAYALVDQGRAFSAHEVLEARWKACPDDERDLRRVARSLGFRSDPVQQFDGARFPFEIKNLLQQGQRQVVALTGEQLLHLGRREVGVMRAAHSGVHHAALDISFGLQSIQVLAHRRRGDAEQIFQLLNRSRASALEMFDDLPKRRFAFAKYAQRH